jgi:hypothetical protein
VGGEAWHGMAFRFSLFTFKDFLGSDSILGEYRVADSLFIENKIPKKEIKCSWPKVMTIRLYNKKGCLRGGEKEKKKSIGFLGDKKGARNIMLDLKNGIDNLKGKNINAMQK